MAVHGFVHCIIEQFPDEVVQPGRINSPDIHSGPFTNRIETLKNGNIFCRVCLLWYCHHASASSAPPFDLLRVPFCCTPISVERLTTRRPFPVRLPNGISRSGIFRSFPSLLITVTPRARFARDRPNQTVVRIQAYENHPTAGSG